MAAVSDPKARWLITYGDLMTLLFSLFVVMYGISSVSVEKFHELLGGLGPFGNPAAIGGGALQGSGGIVGTGGAAPQAQRGSIAGDAAGGLVGEGGWDHDPRHVSPAELPMLERHLREALKAAGLLRRVRFEIGPRGLVVAVATDKVLFETGSAQVSPLGRRIVAALAPTLRELSNPLLIEGHTDTVPLYRHGYDNWNLSTDRAVAVVHLLQYAFGIDPHRLTAIGYGEYRPVASNLTEAGRALNRRVEIVISTLPDPGTSTGGDTRVEERLSGPALLGG
ncbi:MAG: chemotaxis protein MotB [Actinomycetota bacterium]|nr:MAG: chemotaxis protein MotB [Actinomycetota bacterium]